MKKSDLTLLMERTESFVGIIKNSKGPDTVLKVKLGANPIIKHMCEREIICLEVLKGLAVPKRVKYPKEKVAKLVKRKEVFNYVAMELAPGKGCFLRSFPPDQALALWAFTVEQMSAFRRKNILYTDFKHNHLRVPEDFSRVTIVDFDGCLMVEPKGLYPTQYLGFTAELAAPEFHFAKFHTERVIVYQMGMFLGSLFLKLFHNSDINPKAFGKMKTLLAKARVKRIYGLFESCLSRKLADRPRNLDALFHEIEQIELPDATYALWNQLRAPYTKELTKLGFRTPGSSRQKRQAA